MSSDIPRSDERAIAVRLRDQDRCQGCGESKHSSDHLEVHSIVPEHVGVDTLTNYVLLCERCHQLAHQQSTTTSPEGS